MPLHLPAGYRSEMGSNKPRGTGKRNELQRKSEGPESAVAETIADHCAWEMFCNRPAPTRQTHRGTRELALHGMDSGIPAGMTEGV